MDIEALRMTFVLAHSDELQGIFEEAVAEVEKLEAKGQEYKDALDKQTSETMRLSGEHAWCGDFALGQEMNIAKLREALEHTNKTLKSLEAVYDCCKLPDGYDVEATCLADEALKEIK